MSSDRVIEILTAQRAELIKKTWHARNQSDEAFRKWEAAGRPKDNDLYLAAVRLNQEHCQMADNARACSQALFEERKEKEAAETTSKA